MNAEQRASAERAKGSVDGRDWGSHLPVLRALPGLVTIRSVVEFGSGTYSTWTFLTPAIYRDLELLRSFEPDKEWASVVLFGYDARPGLSFSLSLMPELDAVAALPTLAPVDLVFIDSATEEGRLAALEAARGLCRLVVMHDVDYAPYEQASRVFAYRRIWDKLKPWTGIFTDDPELRVVLEAL